MLTKLFGKWFHQHARRAGVPRARAVRPRLECLEDRIVLDTVTSTKPSGPGSLVQAFVDANNGVSTTITFSVAATFTNPFLPPLTHAGTVIDGTTAPGFTSTPVVAIEGGPNLVQRTPLDIEASNVTVKGLAIINYTDGVDIGLTNAVTGTTIQQNFFGLMKDGLTAAPNVNGIGVFHSAGALIGGAAGLGNFISGNSTNGIVVDGSIDTTIQGNSIGPATTSDPPMVGGLAQRQQNGILEDGAAGTLIGSPGLGNNLFNNVNGIQLLGGTGTLVQGNTIGLFVGGVAKIIQPNTNDGVLVNTTSAAPVAIGGTTPGTANTISVNQHDGVEVMAGTSGVGILGNPIFGSGNLDIELHDGANNNAIPPVLTSAVPTSDTTVVVSGTLTAAANTTYRLEFFDNAFFLTEAGASFVAAESVTTDPTGNASFSFTLPLSANPGGTDLITATATDPANNTSQFSAGVIVKAPSSPGPEQSFDTLRVFWAALFAADGFLTGNLKLFLAGVLDFRSLSSSLSGSTLGQAQQQFSTNFSWAVIALVALRD
jgi:hypothetical protein